MKSKLKNFSLLTISTLIMAVGIYFFKFANNFTFGGITGIAVLVAKFLPISASDFSFVVNILLLIIGWIVLGKSFAEKTAYSTILLSVSLSLLERIYPMSHPLTNEPLLELIFAILLPALGSAILFNIGASSGGTDVIAMILKKYTSVDIGTLNSIMFLLIPVPKPTAYLLHKTSPFCRPLQNISFLSHSSSYVLTTPPILAIFYFCRFPAFFTLSQVDRNHYIFIISSFLLA